MSPKTFENILPFMDPELRAIVEKAGPVKQFAPSKSNINIFRKGFDALTARWHNATVMRSALEQCRKQQPWTEHMLTIPTRDGYQMPSKIYRPDNDNKNSRTITSAETRLPVMILVHGGGCCLGGLNTDEFIARFLCSRLNIVIVSVAYRLYPDVVYPIPALDVYDAMSWIQTHTGLDGDGLEDVDLEKGFVGCGVSVGGNLIGSAMYLAVMQKTQLPQEDGRAAPASSIPTLTGSVMLMTGYPTQANDPRTQTSIDLYPGLCKSWDMFQDAPISNRATMAGYAEMMGETCDLNSPLYSLLHIPPDSPLLSQMVPRWYHQISGVDMWRDSTRLWLSILTRGIPELVPSGSQRINSTLPGRPMVKIDDYEGLPHTWWSVYPQVSRTKQWMDDLAAGARWALGNGVDTDATVSGTRANRAML